MRAVLYDALGAPWRVADVADPTPPDDGVVLKVEAAGLCRSDWHGWHGHDNISEFPHVPGHEFAGTVAAIGPDVTRWRVGDRVAVPFVCACGRCLVCESGNHQVCPHQWQPGFDGWGGFAEYVALPAADVKGTRVTAQGYRRDTRFGIEAQVSPNGRRFLWIKGGRQDVPTAPGTDAHANLEGYISVTPMRVDLTAHDRLDSLRAALE